MRAWGSPRNLGRPVVSILGFRSGAPEEQKLLARWWERFSARGSKVEAHGVVLPSAGGSLVGKASGSRSISVVPEKPEKSSRGDPVEGRGMPRYGIAGGRHVGNIGFSNCVNETSAGSEAGAGGAGDGVDDAGPSYRRQFSA